MGNCADIEMPNTDNIPGAGNYATMQDQVNKDELMDKAKEKGQEMAEDKIKEKM